MQEHFWKLIYTSSLSFIFFGLADAGKSIVFPIYYDAGYKFMNSASFIVNYMIGPISLLFMEYFLAKFKLSVILYLGAFSQTIVLIGALITILCRGRNDDRCNEIVVFSSIIFPSLIAGLMATIFYVAYPVYIKNISNPENRSLFYGIGYSIFFGSQVVGNLTGYFILPLLGEYHFLLLILIISSFVQLFYFLVEQKDFTTEPQELSFKHSIISTISKIRLTLKIPKFKKLINFILAYTIVIRQRNKQLESSKYQLFPYLVVVIKDSKKEAELASFIMFIAQSLGSVVGGYAGGKLIQIYNGNWAEYIWTYLMLVAISLSQVGLYFKDEYLLYCGSFSVGVCVNALNVITMSIISNEISQDNIVFTTHNFVGCWGFIFSSIVWTYCIGSGYLFWSCLFQILGAIYIIIALYAFRYDVKRVKVYIKMIEDEKTPSVSETTI